MPTVELWIATDRSDSFSNIAQFVDTVRAASNVPDDQIVMDYSPDASDHEVAVHVVDPMGSWNHSAIPVENETVVVFRKEALTTDDAKNAWRLAYEEKEIELSQHIHNGSRVLTGGQVVIKGVGSFPKSYFRALRKLD